MKSYRQLMTAKRANQSSPGTSSLAGDPILQPPVVRLKTYIHINNMKGTQQVVFINVCVCVYNNNKD